MFADSYDTNRAKRQDRRSLNSSKEARIAQKEKKTAEIDGFLEVEGLLYGPGIAD